MFSETGNMLIISIFHIQECKSGVSYLGMSHTSFQYWTRNILLISKNMREGR